MAALAHCSIARLAEVLGAHQKEIMSEWQVQASVLLRDLDLDKPTLTDHLPNFVAKSPANLFEAFQSSLKSPGTLCELDLDLM